MRRTRHAARERVWIDLTSAGSRAVAIQGDVSREADVLRLFEIAERELGPIGALVNNAAITGGFARVEDIDSAALAQMLAVNIAGTMLCAREAVRRMSTQAGRFGRGHREHFFDRGQNRQRGRVGSLRGIEGRGEHVYHRAGARSGRRRDSGECRRSGFGGHGLHAANGEPGRIARLSPSHTDAAGGHSRKRSRRACCGCFRTRLLTQRGRF